MTSRREFLHLGVAAVAFPISQRVSPAIARSVGSGESASMPFYKVVFDARFPACRIFAGEARSLGLPIHAIRGDVTDLWFNDLDARWKKRPAAIAGITQKGALFCLDLLGADQRMRLMFLGEHVQHRDGRVDHTFAGPPGVLKEAVEPGQQSPDWSRHVARLISRFPADASKLTPAIVAPLVSFGEDPGQLVSWVIAPRGAA
jgi:hypothetical protein